VPGSGSGVCDELAGLDDEAARGILARTAATSVIRTGNGSCGRRWATRWRWSSCRWPGAPPPSGRRDLVPPLLPLTVRLERAFAGRIGDLPAGTRDAVPMAAVDSVDELPEILAATVVLAGQPVGVDVFDSAAAVGLLRFDEMRVSFRHPLVRSGVLQSEHSVAGSRPRGPCRHSGRRAVPAGLAPADPRRVRAGAAPAAVPLVPIGLGGELGGAPTPGPYRRGARRRRHPVARIRVSQVFTATSGELTSLSGPARVEWTQRSARAAGSVHGELAVRLEPRGEVARRAAQRGVQERDRGGGGHA
jgi:hypothetical protein